MKALAGLRVLDLTHMLSGPYATMLLADMGAEIIKLEPLHGEATRALLANDPEHSIDGMGAYFLFLGRNKKSVTLNLKNPDARPILDALVARADIVISNFSRRRRRHRCLSVAQRRPRPRHGRTLLVRRPVAAQGRFLGLFRSAGDGRTVPDLYPDGFLPNLITTVDDASLAVGYRAPLSDTWDWDVSINHGRSKFGFHERNSVNVSWWYEPLGTGIYGQSPTSADTGTLKFDQTTVNLDFRGTIDIGNSEPLSLAVGGEYRSENYAIEAGDPVSYTYGRTNNPRS